jgi:hypothetical protein
VGGLAFEEEVVRILGEGDGGVLRLGWNIGADVDDKF